MWSTVAFECYHRLHRPFPDVADGMRQITTEGGIAPVWGPDNRELFYLTGNAIMVAPVNTQDTFTFGRPQVLFTGNYLHSGSRDFDISPDGQRFLMLKQVTPTLEPSARDELVIVLNWFEELNHLAPITK